MGIQPGLSEEVRLPEEEQQQEVECLCEALGLEAIYFSAISLCVKMWVFKCMAYMWRLEDSFSGISFPPCFETESLVFFYHCTSLL